MWKQFLLGGLALLMAAGCAPKKGEVVQLDAESNGGSVELQVGDELQITLEGNPTTGYLWDLNEVDREVLDMPGTPEYEQQGDLLGSGGLYTLTFVAVKAGQTELSLRYYRPFEMEAPPEDTFVLDVTVK